WHRRPFAGAGDADDAVGCNLGYLFMGLYPREGPRKRVLHNAAVASERDARSVHISRPVPVLRVLGSDAGADVLLDRHLGRQESALLGDKILPVYAGRFGGDAAGRAEALLHFSRCSQSATACR